MIRLQNLWPAAFTVVLMLGWSGPVFAEDAVRGRIKSVRVDSNQFVLAEDSGRDRLYTLAENASVRGGGPGGKAADFKAGEVVIVTYVTINKALYATAVLPAPKEEGRTMEGTIKAITGGVLKKDQFILTDTGGKDWLFTLTDKARVATATDPNASLRDLKVGDRVEVTYVRVRGGVYASEVRHPARSQDTRQKVGTTREPNP